MQVAASTAAAGLGPPAGAPLAGVNRELVGVITDEWWLRLDRARLPRLIAVTDLMLDELEALNLADVRRVSAEWRERLVLLFASLPFHYRPRLRAFPSPTEVLDIIFDVQEHLFALRNDGLPATPQEAGA
jgi:hypothetical protein